MTFLYAIGLLSLGAMFGFFVGTVVAKRVPIDTTAAAIARRRSVIVGLREKHSKPDLVLISPDETAEVRSIESRYVSPDSNLLRSGGYQPRPGNHRPAVPTTGSGVQKLNRIT
jgi:hypothetical protein